MANKYLERIAVKKERGIWQIVNCSEIALLFKNQSTLSSPIERLCKSLKTIAPICTGKVLALLSSGNIRATEARTLLDIEPFLDPELFIRAHREYMLNLDFINEIIVNKKHLHFCLKNEKLPNRTTLPFSRKISGVIREKFYIRMPDSEESEAEN